MKTLCGIIFLLFCIALPAQVPVTGLYQFQLTKDDTSAWHIHSPIYLSHWNEGGYINQPEWIGSHTLLVSVRIPGDTQNDIYEIDLQDRYYRKCTATPESEFSPTLGPDTKHFTVVAQKHQAQVDQQIVVFPLSDESETGQYILPDVRNVGYYAWLDEANLAAVTVDSSGPFKLGFADINTKSFSVYSSQIGRCLKRTSHGHLAYVHKYSDSFWFLKTYNPADRRSEIVVETLFQKEDFAIGPKGEYFMGSGSTIYVFDPASGQKVWRPVFDLSIFGITAITRLAISTDYRIAVVDQRS